MLEYKNSISKIVDLFFVQFSFALKWMNKSNLNPHPPLSLWFVFAILARAWPEIVSDPCMKWANQCAVRMNHDGHTGSSCCHLHQFDLWSVARSRQLKMYRTGWYGKTKNVVIDKQMTLSIIIYYKFYVGLR
jgi:hypothetical protein